jgi:hypothetical protein
MCITRHSHIRTCHIPFLSTERIWSLGLSRHFTPFHWVDSSDSWLRYYHSSSCGVRSAVICYNIGHKFTFNPDLLVKGVNEFVLSLPANATDYESAVLPTSVYVQYDALRLEIK